VIVEAGTVSLSNSDAHVAAHPQRFVQHRVAVPGRHATAPADREAPPGRAQTCACILHPVERMRTPSWRVEFRNPLRSWTPCRCPACRWHVPGPGRTLLYLNGVVLKVRRASARRVRAAW